ncbi:MAG: hypothetical protein M3451_05785, partial [Chloroflexota bacterium]|nr:hypothetical protein [Chloroflexota bacterium]
YHVGPRPSTMYGRVTNPTIIDTTIPAVLEKDPRTMRVAVLWLSNSLCSARLTERSSPGEPLP